MDTFHTFMSKSSGEQATELVALAVGLFVAYALALAVYRVYFHPLSKFPGSPWAAVSRWYEVYWNVWHPGALVFELERLHKIHGPIVRVGPNEVHVNHPDYHNKIFKPGSKFIKEKYHYDAFCIPDSLPGLVDPSIIRTRREALRPLFQRNMVIERWEMITSRMNRLVERLRETKGAVGLHQVISCFTLDVIAEITFSQDFGAVESPTFYHPFQEQAEGAQRSLWVMKLFPALRKIAVTLQPYTLNSKMQAGTVIVLNSVNKMIDDYFCVRTQKGAPQEKLYGDKLSHLNAIDRLMNPNAARSWVVPNKTALTHESLTLLAGGTETVAMATMQGIYQILQNPKILSRLKEELATLQSSSPTWEEYESLPYLQAIIKETLRYSAPVPGRLPRIVPEGGMEVNGFEFPAGTIVGMSAYIAHRNPEVFADGDEFIPERWLTPESKQMDRNILTFSKGPGQCLGINLAWAELYILFATIFRNFDVHLDKNTTSECVKWTDNIVTLFRGPTLKAEFVPLQAVAA